MAMNEKEMEVFRLAMERFKMVSTAEKEQRELAIEDIRFSSVEGAMWDDDTSRKFVEADRPRIEINRIDGTVNTIMGEMFSNEFTTKFRAAGGGATPDVANTLNGLKRNVDASSYAKEAHETAAEEITRGGYGAWRVNTVVGDNDLFDQDIMIEPISSAASSVWFGPSKKKSKIDAPWCFVTDRISLEEFKDKYPDHSPTDFDDNLWRQGFCDGWVFEDEVMIAEYWLKVPTKIRLGKLTDGRVIDLDEEEAILDELADEGVFVEREVTRDSHKLVQYILSGSTILEGPHDWAGKIIPIIQIFGHWQVIQGVEHVRGVVRMAKDPSRVNNYASSAIVEAAASSHYDPFWMTKKQAVGHESEIATMNTDRRPVRFYNHEAGVPMPARTGPPAVQQALIGLSQQSAQDVAITMGTTSGIAQSQQGTDLDHRSGAAVREQGRKGDIASFRFVNSVLEGIEQEARIFLDLAPRIYDVERQVRILNPDGTEEFVTLNETKLDEETGDEIIVNDLSMGKFDVAVDTGPAFTTQRNEAFDRLMNLATQSDVFASMMPDLLAKNMGIADADEMHKRARQFMIKTGAVQPTEEEVAEIQKTAPQQPSKAEQIAEAKEIAAIRMLNAEAGKTEAEAQKMIAEAEYKLAQARNQDFSSNKIATEAAGQDLDNIEKQVALRLPLDGQDADIRQGQDDLQEISQVLINPGQTSGQLGERE